jgi:hypothetical protein
MAQETFDYSAMLADARAKRAALDAFITSLENAQAAGALGQPGTAPVNTGGFSGGPAVELPLGALMNKSVSSAIKIYLGACKKKQTVREIATALKDGGVESTSNNFEIIVYNTLRKLKKADLVLQFRDGWGLAELYPEGIRNRLAQQDNGPKRTAKAKRKTKITAQKEPVRPSRKAGMAEIEAILQSDKAKTFSISEIAAKLGLNPAGMQLTLGKMVKAGKIEKGSDGRFRALTGGVHQVPKAS